MILLRKCLAFIPNNQLIFCLFFCSCIAFDLLFLVRFVMTYPLLHETTPLLPLPTLREISIKLREIAMNIKTRCINSSTNEKFTINEIADIITKHNIPIIINLETYEHATRTIEVILKNNYLPIAFENAVVVNIDNSSPSLYISSVQLNDMPKQNRLNANCTPKSISFHATFDSNINTIDNTNDTSTVHTNEIAIRNIASVTIAETYADANFGARIDTCSKSANNDSTPINMFHDGMKCILLYDSNDSEIEDTVSSENSISSDSCANDVKENFNQKYTLAQRIENMRNAIANQICRHSINFETGEQYTFDFVLNEMRDLEFNIRLDRSASQQGIRFVQKVENNIQYIHIFNIAKKQHL